MLSYKLKSLELQSTGAATAQVRAVVEIADATDTDLRVSRDIVLVPTAGQLASVNNLLDNIAAALGAKIPGNPGVVR